MNSLLQKKSSGGNKALSEEDIGAGVEEFSCQAGSSSFRSTNASVFLMVLTMS